MTQVDPRALLPMRRRTDLEHPGGGPLIAIATLLAVAAVAETASRGLVQPLTALAFAILIAIGEVVRVRLPGDREIAPVGVAAALAYALVIDIDGTLTRHDAWQVAAVTAFAATAGALPYLAAGKPAHLEDVARRVLLATATAAMFRPFAERLRPHDNTVVLVMLGAVLIAGVLDALLSSLVRAGGDPVRLRTALRDEVRATG